MSTYCRQRFPVRVNLGISPSAELVYDIGGTDDDTEAAALLLATAPTRYDPWGTGLIWLPRTDIAIERTGEETWEATVVYGARGTTGDEEESEYEYETGGGSKHITHSLETVGRYAPAGTTAPNYQGAINVTANGVEGVDIVWPVFHWSETHYLSSAVVTQEWAVAVAQISGCVNSTPFRGFARGEVLFLGVSGRKRGDGVWQMRFAFAMQHNQTDLSIGGITGIACEGWHLIWTRYREQEDSTAGCMVQVPIGVYVERVYNYADLGGVLGI